VPMDPVYPEERLRFMVKDAGVKYVIAGEGERERFVGASGAGGAEGRGEGGESRGMDPVECCVVVNAGGGVEQVWEVEGSGGKQRVWCGQEKKEKKEKKEKGKGKEEGGGGVSGPGNLAYCIYTSGSTGQPNGVLVEQRQVVRLMKNSGFAFAVSAEDVWTLFHSYCFDFSVWEIWGALLYGGRLVVVPREVTRDPGALVKLLREEKVTVLNQTPASFYNVAREAVEQKQQKQRKKKKGEQGEDLDLALRYVIFGGEALQPAYLKPWKEAYPEVKLVNMYGITETTVHVTVREVQERDIEQGRSNIGVPIATTRTYILNAEMEPVPVGVTGEIYVGGEGLARGYAGRAGLTAERFVADPLGGEAGGRLYRTGDLARYGADGTMEYRGRMDHQVKVRGYRIELGEIEAALLGQGGVSRAVVVLRESGAEKQLVGYVVGDGRKGKLDLNELRQGIREKLPSYMVPGAMVELDALPLTSNGKVDRKALPHPDANWNGTGYVSPRTPEEETLCQIMCEVLNLEKVGVHDSFFEIGGHSLLATQVMSRIRTLFAVELPLRVLFEMPTVAGLAENVARHQTQTTARDDSPIRELQMKRMLAEIENLSEEEIQTLLDLQEQES